MATIRGSRGLSFKVEVDPKSTAEVVRSIKKYEKRKKKQIGILIEKTIVRIHNEAKADILVRTGKAKRSTVRGYNKDGRYTIGGTVETKVGYAEFIERMKPYLVKAYNKHAPRFYKKLKKIAKSK